MAMAILFPLCQRRVKRMVILGLLCGTNMTSSNSVLSCGQWTPEQQDKLTLFHHRAAFTQISEECTELLATAAVLGHSNMCQEAQRIESPRENEVHKLSTSPKCADGLLVTIRQPSSKEVTTEENDSCQGFLLRDDAVLTSSVCASNESVVVNVPTSRSHDGQWVVGSKITSLHHNLVILRLEPPQHGQKLGQLYNKHSGWPRRRIFLNEEKAIDQTRNPSHASTNMDNVLLALSCEGNGTRPILSAFSSNDGGDGLLSIQLYRKEADSQDVFNDALQDMLHFTNDKDDTLAEMTNEFGERWWIKKQSRENLDRELRKIQAKYAKMAGQGELSIAKGMQGVLELEDPKVGRPCLIPYYRHWLSQVPFSGEPFFQWLDYGSGRHLELPICSRKRVDGNHIEFFDVTERRNAMVDLNISAQGDTVRLLFAHTRLPVPRGEWLFVWGRDKRLYLVREQRAKFIHMSVFVEEPVLHAGELQVGSEGKLLSINPDSGHYGPKIEHVHYFFRYLTDLGMLRHAVDWQYVGDNISEDEWKTVFS